MRRIVRPVGLPVPDPSFSPAVQFDRWVFVSGQSATDYRSGLAPEANGNPAVPLSGEDPMMRESRCIFQRLEQILAEAGTDLQQAVRIDQFPTTAAVMDPYHVVRREFLVPPRPASTSVLVDALMAPEAKIEVELIAIVPDGEVRKEGIATDRIPQPLAGYAPAIRVGDFVFLAAQVATDFETGLAPEARRHPSFWEGSEVELETRYVLRHFATVLAAAGSSLNDVVKAQIYLTDINDLPRLDRVWREAFPEAPPARTVLPVSGLGIAGTRIEINLVALVSQGRTRKQVVSTDRATRPLFHESQGVRAGNLLFLSGLMAADADGLVDAARVNPHYPYAVCSAAEQMEDIMRQATAICEAAGARLRDGVRLLTAHTDVKEWPMAANVRRRFFPDGQPATTSVQVPGPLQVPGCTVLADLWIGIGDG